MFIDVARNQIVFTPTGELERTGKLIGYGDLGRVRIGITDETGVRVAHEFEQVDDALVPVSPIPTEKEIEEQFLSCAGWQKTNEIDGAGPLWEDPETGGAYCLENALQIQESRSAHLEISYYAGKVKPHRASFVKNGKKVQVGDFAIESDAWDAAHRAAQSAR